MPINSVMKRVILAASFGLATFQGSAHAAISGALNTQSPSFHVVSLIGGFLLMGLFGCLYFLPTIIGRRKRNVVAIFVLNLFLGWSGLGWIVALIWSCTVDRDSIR